MEFLKKMFGKKEESGCGCQHEQQENQNQASTSEQAASQPEQQTHDEQNQ